MNSIQFNGGRSMQYLYEKCAKEDSPMIVFVHGFPLDHSMWQGQLPLAEHASLLMPDLPGFGKSDSLPNDVTMKDYAAAIAELLGQLEIAKVIFCGLSMGGYIGWEFAKNHVGMLEGLICCNTRAAADDEVTARARRVAAQQVIETGADPVATAMREKLFSAHSIANRTSVVERIVNTIRQTDPQTIAAAQIGMSRRADHTDFLDSIEAKTLVIAGADDIITPSSEMQEMSFLIGEATFVEIADAGHLSPAEQPEVFNNAVVHWLS